MVSEKRRDEVAFFRTRDNQRDPRASEEARRQRRQQQQAQQQLLDAQKMAADHETRPLD
jgi:hypothetical protein